MHEEKSLKELMGKMFETYHLSDKLSEQNLLKNWEELMGRTIAKNTKKLYVNGKVLYLEVESAALKNDLVYFQNTIIEKVNQFAGSELITSVKIK